MLFELNWLPLFLLLPNYHFQYWEVHGILPYQMPLNPNHPSIHPVIPNFVLSIFIIKGFIGIFENLFTTFFRFPIFTIFTFREVSDYHYTKFHGDILISRELWAFFKNSKWRLSAIVRILVYSFHTGI